MLFNRLMSEPSIKTKLEAMRINQVTDIEILLGVETYTQFDVVRDPRYFELPPSNEDIVNLSKKFEYLGGILMTEVDPEGTIEQKEEFIGRITSLLPETPYFKGIIFYNIFISSGDTPDNIFDRTVLEFFSDDSTPTRLYYELLRH